MSLSEGDARLAMALTPLRTGAAFGRDTTHPHSSMRCGLRVIAHAAAPKVGGWACHRWRRVGEALLVRVSGCCREAAAPLGTPFLRNALGWELCDFNPPPDDGSTDGRSRPGRPAIAILSRPNVVRFRVQSVTAATAPPVDVSLVAA